MIRSIEVLNRMVNRMDANETIDRDEQVGVEILRSALSLPVWQIAENAGVSGAVVVDAVKKLKNNFGYNAATGAYEDLVKAGIVDPKKVTRSALQTRCRRQACCLRPKCW